MLVLCSMQDLARRRRMVMFILKAGTQVMIPGGAKVRDMVLILSFDGANGRSVARKLRAERVFCKIVPADIAPDAVKEQEPLGIILAGGSQGSLSLPGFHAELLDLGLPLLALGDAAAAVCAALGGQAADSFLEQTAATVTYQAELPLFEEVPEGERMMTFVRPLELSEGLSPAAWSSDAVIGFVQQEKKLYGLQFQVEQNDPDGIQILANFALKVCGCTAWWDSSAFIARAVDEVRRVAGEGGVICAISGGVDSGVCAMLGHKAVGARMKCVFVDTGLMRKGESEYVLAFYRDVLGLKVEKVDAADRFLRELSGIVEPQRKKRVISRLLQDILTAEAGKNPDAAVILQGTNYSDSPDGMGADSRMSMNDRYRQAVLVEPVKELFKDEIRRVGEELGMPPEIYTRQPFPGAGLALRIMGDVTAQRLTILREADAIFLEEIAASGQGKRLWKHFAVLSDLGEHGMNGIAICLRAVHASESSTAMAARLPSDLLERVSMRILKALPQVVRVLYDLTPGYNFAGIEWQ